MAVKKPISFREVAEALAKSKDRIASMPTIAYRMKRGHTMVVRALSAMAVEGIVKQISVGGREMFELLDVKVTPTILRPLPGRGAPPKPQIAAARPAPAETEVGEDLDDDADDAIGVDFHDQALSEEHARAARMWAERMGDQRWSGRK